MRSSSYVVRRGGQLYFRMRVPADIHSFIGKQELKRTLGTGDRRVAHQRAAVLAITAFRLIATIRNQDVLSDEKIAALIRAFYSQKLESDEATRIGATDNPDVTALAEAAFDARDTRLRKLKRDAAVGRLAPGVDGEAHDDLARSLGCENISELQQRYSAQEIEDTLMQLRHGYMRAAIEAEQRAKERDEGDWSGVPSDPMLQPAHGPDPVRGPTEHALASNGTLAFTPTEKGQLTPSEYVELVVTEKQLRPSAAVKYRATMRAFEQILGAKPMYQYTEDDAVRFKDTLLTVPVYANHIPGCGNLLNAIAWNEAQPLHKRKKTLKPRTINEGYLPFLRQVFRHAKKNRHVTIAIGQDVDVASTPGQRRGEDNADARHAFSITKLNKIFRQPLYVGSHSGSWPHTPGSYLDWSWRFWLPLAMLFMGVRPQELGQLEVTDVIHRVGHPCLFIRTASDADDRRGPQPPNTKQNKKRVKSRAGTRELPVHPVLLQLGFMDRVRAVEIQLETNPKEPNDVRVFPEWPDFNGRYAPAATKFFNRDEIEKTTGRPLQGLLPRAGVKNEDNALYSLRHNYKAALQNCGFAEGEQDLLMGHAGKHVSRIYQNREAYRLLIEKVCKLEHEGLDLGPMLRARSDAVQKANRLDRSSKVVPLNRGSDHRRANDDAENAC